MTPMDDPKTTEETPESQTEVAAAADSDNGAGGGEEAAGSADKVATAEPAPTKPSWQERRVQQLTAQLARTRAELAASRVAPAPVDPATAREATIEQEAERRMLAKSFDADCMAAREAGNKAFGADEFGGRVKALVDLVDQSDPQGAASYQQFLLAALATGEAPKIIHTLGGDQDEAQRIMGLSPVKMAVELTKLALKEVKGVSQTPRPINPVGTRGSAHTAIDPTDKDGSDRLSTAEWMKRREAQVAERSKRH